MIKGRKIPELSVLKNVLYSTIKILTYDNDGKEYVGTGFFFNFNDDEEFFPQKRIPVIVTNKHVVRDAVKGILVFHLEPVDGDIPTGGTHEIQIDDFESKFIPHPDPDIDICILEIEQLLNQIYTETSLNVYYQPFTSWQIPDDIDLKEMFPISDVYMIGYPDGMWDETNNLPLARKGATASHPFFDFNQKSEGVVDIAVFAGSSGSPIISYHFGAPRYDSPPEIKFKLLGILWGGAFVEMDGKLIIRSVPTAKVKVPSTKIMMHLGYYIKAKELNVFESILIKKP